MFSTNAPILLESTDNIERKIGAYENAGQGMPGLAAMLIKSGVLAIVGRKAKTNNSEYPFRTLLYQGDANEQIHFQIL